MLLDAFRGGGGPEHDIEKTGFDDPFVFPIEHFQIPFWSQRETDSTGFPGLERNAFKSAQHLLERRDRRDDILDVELHHFITRPIPGVGNVAGNSERVGEIFVFISLLLK